MAYATTSQNCWNYSNGYFSGSPATLSEGKFSFDTTAWVNTSYTFEITITDSSSRTVTSSVLTISTSNPLPTISFFSAQDWSHVVGTLHVTSSVIFDPEQSVVTVSSYCWQFDNGVCRDSQNIALGTGWLKNGAHQLCLSITDTVGRKPPAVCQSIDTYNPSPQLSNIRVSAVKPAPGATSVSIQVSVTSSYASIVKVRYGTTAQMPLSKWLVLDQKSSSNWIQITGLTSEKTYFLQVVGNGPNGTASSQVFAVKTFPIPPPARIVRSACTANQYVGYSIWGSYLYWVYFNVYYWSDGNVTHGPSLISLRVSRPC